MELLIDTGLQLLCGTVLVVVNGHDVVEECCCCCCVLSVFAVMALEDGGLLFGCGKDNEHSVLPTVE